MSTASLPSAPGHHDERAARTAIGARCVRIKKNGDQCGALALIGLTLCRAHGGNSSVIRAHVSQQLAEVSPVAVQRIKELLTPPPPGQGQPCPLCRRDMPLNPDITARLSIAVLDRTGHGPSATLEVNHTNDDGWVEYLTEPEVIQLIEMKARAKERMGEAPIDVEVIPQLEAGAP